MERLTKMPPLDKLRIYARSLLAALRRFSRSLAAGSTIPQPRTELADEYEEWLGIENDSGELVGVRCPDCQTEAERADVLQ